MTRQVGVAGLKHPPKTSGKTESGSTGDAHSDARVARTAGLADPELARIVARIVAAWPTLPANRKANLKAAVQALVDAAANA